LARISVKKKFDTWAGLFKVEVGLESFDRGAVHENGEQHDNEAEAES
jgi:hypothetical protein